MHKIIKCEADDLRFVMFNHALHHRQWVKKSFAGYFSINYAHTGFVRHRVDDGLERVLHAPVAWWTWPGPEFQYGNLVAPGWDHYYVCYAGDLLKKWKREGWMPPPEASTAWRHPQDPEAFRDKMLALHQHIATGKSRRAMLGLLDLLLDVKEGDVSRDSLGERVRAIAASLRERPAEGCDEDLHADSLAVSAVHFRRLFFRETGLPPHRFIMDARLQQAAARLRGSDSPLKQIADECGFFDEYHLSRLFRRKFGLPPGAYRNQARQLGASFSRPD
jgi:AraC family transcriptional regulator